MKPVEHLRWRKEQIIKGADQETKKKLFYDKGMYPPRERINKLFDPGTFFELDMFATHHCKDFGMENKTILADAVITGYGLIDGRKVFVYSQDFSAMGGSYGEMTGKKICAIMDTAAEVGAPIIGICHSGGLRLHETLGPMEMFGQLFKRNTIYSGVVPQISIILGVVAGGQAYSPGLTDFILMTKDSSIFIAGPAFVKAQTGKEISEQELGSATMHARVSGLVDIFRKTEDEIFEEARNLIGYLPSSCRETPPEMKTDDDANRLADVLNTIAPAKSQKAFDMHDVLKQVFDDNVFFETKPDFAKNIITGYARLAGSAVGVVANQSKFLGGVIDIKASEKAARFVRFCDAFNIPVISFQDSPAYLIGKEMEEGGIIFRGAKLLHAYAEATVPKITILVRKAYAGAYIALGSQYIGADLVYAWPGAEITSVGATTAASILFRDDIKSAKDDQEVEALYQKYYDEHIVPYTAASLRHINDIIVPEETRPVLIKSLEILKGKKQIRPEKKHGNIPL